MLRRLKLFGVGLFIGLAIIFSIPKLKDNFLQYVDWGDSNEWVINNLKFEFEDTTNKDNIIYSENLKKKLLEEDMDFAYLLKVLDGGWVNIKKSKKDIMPRKYVIDNLVEENELSVHFSFDEKQHQVSVDDFYINQGISKKSYFSYFAIFAIFLVIMVPVLLLLRKLIRKRRLEDQ